MSKIIFTLILIFFLFLAVPSLAQDSTTDSTKSTTIRDRKQEAREALKDRVEARLKAASEAAKTKREAFKEKVAKIRDAKKKAIVERVQERIDSINKKRVEQMSEFLDRLTKTLGKIESRKDKAKASGRDVTAIEAAIKDARTVVDKAQAAVEAQAGKTYVVEIATEAGLKNTVGKAISTLQKDLRNTHKIVVEAKQAVQKVFSLLKGVKGVDDAD